MAITVAFARYCLPTMFFMGVHVVLGQVLNARGRFGAMMWTPVLNNIVITATFGVFIWAFGGFTGSGISPASITPEGVQLLGIGTLVGLVVQALAMLPYVRDAGVTLRPRFDFRGHGLGKAMGLAKWTLLFVLANQIGMVVVTQLATKAGAVAERTGHTGSGITAYNFAYQMWQMPQAIITVSVMTAVLPRISRAAQDGDIAAVRDDLSYGLRARPPGCVRAGRPRHQGGRRRPRLRSRPARRSPPWSHPDEVGLLARRREAGEPLPVVAESIGQPGPAGGQPHGQLWLSRDAGEVGEGRAEPTEILTVPGSREPRQQLRFLQGGQQFLARRRHVDRLCLGACVQGRVAAHQLVAAQGLGEPADQIGVAGVRSQAAGQMQGGGALVGDDRVPPADGS